MKQRSVRRAGREAAVQLLYLRDLNSELDNDQNVRNFWAIRNAPDAVKEFCEELARGTLQSLPEIDDLLAKHTHHYELDRLSAVDRNILRLAVYEMLHRLDIPPVVSINEAIEIAKSMGTEESGRFVNGILDHLRAEIDRPARTAAPNS